MWNKTCGGTGFEEAQSVQEVVGGGYAIAGHTTSFGAGSRDVWLIKTDYKGVVEWDNTFGTECEEQCWGMQVTSDGGYILVGRIVQGTGDNLLLIKTDMNGDTEWTKTYGGSRNDGGNSVFQTMDGGYIVMGATESFGTDDADLWLIKTDSKGDKEWDVTYGGTGLDSGSAVMETNEGGYIIAGRTESFGAGSADIWLIKTNSYGIEEWSKTFGGSSFDSGYSVDSTIDGGYVITGRTASYGPEDIIVIKTDSNGTEEWTKLFGGSGLDEGLSVRQASDNGYIVAGWTLSYGLGSADVYLVKIESGNIPSCENISINWGEATPMDQPRAQAGSVVANGKIYIIGGESSICGMSVTNQVYDMDTDTWDTLSEMSVPRIWPTVSYHDNKLYVAGGAYRCSSPRETNSLEIYDIQTDSWYSNIEPMPQARDSYGATIVGDKLYVMGRGNSDGILDTLEIYNIATGKWSLGAKLLSPELGKAAAIGDRIYFLGHGTGNLQEYDTVTGDWSYKSPWPDPRFIIYGGIEVFDGKLLVISAPIYDYPFYRIYVY